MMAAVCTAGMLAGCGSGAQSQQAVTEARDSIYVDIYPVYTSAMFADAARDLATDANRDMLDSITAGIDRYRIYAPVDTAAVNTALNGLPEYLGTTWLCRHTGDSSALELIIYSREPVMSELVGNVHVDDNPEMYGDDAVIGFRFTDRSQWAQVTGDAVGQMLAVSINGRIMTAPRVNCPITSGNCSVTVPRNRIRILLTDHDSPDQ